MRVRLLIGVLAVFGTRQVAAQAPSLPPVPDSLRTALAAAPAGAARAAVLLRVARAYHVPFDSAGVVGYARAAEQAARQAQRPDLTGRALDFCGNYYREAGQPALALPLLRRAGRLLTQAPAVQRAWQRYHLGMAYGDLGQPARALALYHEAARLGADDSNLRANIFNSYGILYARLNQLDSAATNYIRSLRLVAGLADRESESATFGNLGLVYFKQRRWAEAARYLRRGKALEAAAGDTMGLASSWYNLGRTLLGRDSVGAALCCARLSARLAQRSHLANYLPQAWLLMGQAHQRLHRPDSARYFLLRAATVQHRRGAAGELATALSALADFYLQQQEWAAAERTARLIGPAPGAALHLRAQAWGTLRQVALHRRDYPAAYVALARQQSLQDSLRTLENQQLTEGLRAAYETDQAEAQVRALTHEREVRGLRDQRRTLGLVLGAVLLLAGGGGFVLDYRRRQLRRELALRTRLSADLHDEVGALLTQVSMQADLLGAGIHAPDQQQAQLREVAATSRLAATQLQDVVWSFDARNDGVGPLLDRLRDHAYEVLQYGEVTVTFEADAASTARVLPAEVRRAFYLIFKEALTNIRKHSLGAGHVQVALLAEPQALALTVADDGPPPPPGTHARASGHGLRNMQARASAVGGSCTTGFGAVAGQAGFGVRVWVPVA